MRSAAAATTSASCPGATRIVTPAVAWETSVVFRSPGFPPRMPGDVERRLDERTDVELFRRPLVERHRTDAGELVGAGR